MSALSTDRWRAASPCLDEALELPPSDRTEWLARLEERNPAVAADVRALLENYDALNACAFLEGSAGPLPADSLDPSTTTLPPGLELPGAAFGNYRLIRELGAGGMGVVWLAQQERPLRRLVAIKVVRCGEDSNQVLSRLEAERQALAILNHPGIPKVFEAGTTSDGRPYFVMEHIAGSSIAAFADQQRLTVTERLRLFIQVCQAVEHAHQNGVLHRDLKPKNILVCDEYGRHGVKVIDFGVAKGVGVRLTGETLHTKLGAIVGTPDYMSPEQAGLISAAVDVRTDVYSLGLVLYEILAGAPPFQHRDLRRRTVVEALRVIRDEEAPYLTQRLTSQGDAALRETAHRRGTEPRTLVRQLRGDLEWITAHAIEKEPGRRYGSVSELRADIERHLKDEPVVARPPSAIYRAGKFARQQRALAATVIIPVVAIVLTGTTFSVVRARRAELLVRRQAIRSLVTRDFAKPDNGPSSSPLTSLPGTEAAAAWSPDGRRVAFMWNGEGQDDYDVYVMQPGSNQTLRITKGPGADADPAWSPDGRSIAYVHSAPDQSHYSLNVVSSGGGSPLTLLTNSAPVGRPTWTPDGQFLVIEIAREPRRQSQVWAIPVNAGQRRQLTFPPADTLGDVAPALSPDGGTLAFCRKLGRRTADLFLLDLRQDLNPAGAPRRVTHLGDVERPAWTPEGTRILFGSTGEGAGIRQVDLSTRRVLPVNGPPNTAAQPAIARRPDGATSLIFTNLVATKSIWRYSTTQGSGLPPAELVPSKESQTFARYSNDGRRLAFSSVRSGHQEIWVAGADGSRLVQLTALQHQLTEMGHWSPSDDVIAFVSQGRGPRQIFVIDSSGGPAVTIARTDGTGSGSGWSRDGKFYYYNSPRSGRREVWKVSRHGGRPQQVTVTGGENGFETPRGTFYYWRQHAGHASLMRRTPNGDVEVPLSPGGHPQSLTVPTASGFYYRAASTHSIYLYDESTGRSVRVLDLVGKPFRDFTISPDGRWFAAGFPHDLTVDLAFVERFK